MRAVEKIEIETDLAVRSCQALISCVDELQAIHTIKFGHITETQNPSVQRRMDTDEVIKNSAIGVLVDLYTYLETLGLAPVVEFHHQNLDEGAD